MRSVERMKLPSIGLTLTTLLLVFSAATDSEAAGKFPADAPEVVVQTKCPPLREYDVATGQKLGSELAALKKVDPTAAAPRYIADYKLLRDQCRAYSK